MILHFSYIPAECCCNELIALLIYMMKRIRHKSRSFLPSFFSSFEGNRQTAVLTIIRERNGKRTISLEAAVLYSTLPAI